MTENSTGRRIAALNDYAILDTVEEAGFDDIVFLAAQLSAAPIALVSLVEIERQWFKARHGLAVRETPIDQSVCALGLESRDLLIIPDLTADNRTCLNTLVTDGPEIRFYAGAPLVTPQGVCIGMLCVIDFQPRPAGLDEAQQRMLAALANQVITLLETRKAARITARIAARHIAAEQAGGVGTFEVDVTTDVMSVSPHFCRIFGVPVREIYTIAELSPLVSEQDVDIVSSEASRAAGSADSFVEYRIQRPDGQHRWIARRGEFLHDETGRATHMIGIVQDVTDQRLVNGEISHRLKNTLAIVQSIATHTLRRVADREPVLEFNRRLLALGTAHDVLLQRTLKTAPMRAIVDAVIDTLGIKVRTLIEGPHVEISSQSTLTMAMLIHELATNSMKYGALSVPGGVNRIRWGLEDQDETFTLDWIEQGGPPAVRPEKNGFGSRLIERGLGQRSAVTTRYDERGFAASFRVALAAIA